MKKIKILIVLFIISLISLNSFAQKNKGFDITLKINSYKDSICVLGYHYGDNKYVKDTFKFDSKGICHLKGDKALNPGIYLVILSKNNYFELVINKNQFFEIETDTSNFIESLKVKGDEENKVFNDFQRFMIKNQKELMDINSWLAKHKDTLTANQDSLKLMRKEQEELNNIIEKYQKDFALTNKDMLISKVINLMRDIDVPEKPKDNTDEYWEFKYRKKHYWDNIDLTDDVLLYTPVFHPKLMNYFNNMIHPDPDSIIKEAQFVIEKSRKDSNMFRYLVVKLTNKYESSNYMGMDKVFVNLAEKYYLSGDAYWADSSMLSKIKERVTRIKPNLLGSQAPPIYLLDTLDNLYPLYDVQAKYTIMLFYDPECGHCKKFTQELKDIYDNYKREDVEVYGVCTVTDKEKWVKYLKLNNLKWINVADIKLQSNFRAWYDLYSTPVIYVLDENKKIIAKRLNVEQTQEMINDLLKRNSEK